MPHPNEPPRKKHNPRHSFHDNPPKLAPSYGVDSNARNSQPSHSRQHHADQPAAGPSRAASVHSLYPKSEPISSYPPPPPPDPIGRDQSALSKKWHSLSRAFNLGLKHGPKHLPRRNIMGPESLVPTIDVLFTLALEETGTVICPWRGCDASTTNAAAFSQHLYDVHSRGVRCEVEDELGLCGIIMTGINVQAHFELKHGLIFTDTNQKRWMPESIAAE